MALDLARHPRWKLVSVAAAALIGGCTGNGEAPSARTASSDSTALAFTHVNGAELHTPPPAPRGRRASRASSPAGADGGSANASTSEPARATEARHDDVPSDAPAATPAELSALAASLVVPVVGVSPAELHSSFHAPRGGGTRQHNAIDIPAPRGRPVISATDGRVLRLYYSKAGGMMVYATDATERFILMYGHLDRYALGLRDGARLTRGQTIGYVGTTGNAPPNVPHLHFAIARTNDVRRWWAGTPIDPAPLLKR